MSYLFKLTNWPTCPLCDDFIDHLRILLVGFCNTEFQIQYVEMIPFRAKLTQQLQIHLHQHGKQCVYVLYMHLRFYTTKSNICVCVCLCVFVFFHHLQLCVILEPMQELMSRHKTYNLSPRDCLKTCLFQKWQRMVAPPGNVYTALLTKHTVLQLSILCSKWHHIPGIVQYFSPVPYGTQPMLL